MHLRGPFAQRGCIVEMNSNGFTRHPGDFTTCRRVRRRGMKRAMFVVAAQLVERNVPPVPLVGHQLLQHRERGASTLWLVVFGCSGCLRDVLESGALGEKAADFEIRIRTLLHPPE